MTTKPKTTKSKAAKKSPAKKAAKKTSAKKAVKKVQANKGSTAITNLKQPIPSTPGPLTGDLPAGKPPFDLDALQREVINGPDSRPKGLIDPIEAMKHMERIEQMVVPKYMFNAGRDYRIHNTVEKLINLAKLEIANGRPAEEVFEKYADDILFESQKQHEDHQKHLEHIEAGGKGGIDLSKHEKRIRRKLKAGRVTIKVKTRKGSTKINL